jgi:hypothetical protein
MQLEGTIAAGQFTLTGAGDSPDDDGSFEMTVTMDAIEGTFSASIPEGASMAGAALLSSGLNLDMKLAYGPVRADVAFAAEDGEGAVTSSAASGTFDMALAPESLTYASTGTGIAYAMEASTLPVPSLAATIAEAAFRLHAPLAPADAPADFQVLTALRGLELDDNLWSLFDPTAMLDRGAANLVIDLSGKVRLLADIFGDPEAMAEMDTPPAELHALTLNDLELTVAGAQLTGTGAFTFDNTRTEMLDGFPQPAGKAMFKLVGATALIDKLVQMGLLPEESAMQARMSLMMLAKPTGAEDSFTSEVEVSPEGKLLVNGVALN